MSSENVGKVFNISGKTGAAGKDGSPGAKGDPGDTWVPSVNEDTGDLTWAKNSGADPSPVNIKGPKGDKGEPGSNGAAGTPGAAGKDGVSPTVKTSKSGTVTTVTITDAQGDHQFEISDGAKGEPGTNGANGKDGSPGAAGPAGPNEVSTETATDITGILKGNGSNVGQAVDGEDYLSPTAADDRYLPIEDPGFTGMLWSADEDGNGVQALAGYDSGDGNKTTYVSVYGADGQAADIGASKRDKIPYTYLTLGSRKNRGAVEMQASDNGAEICIRSKNAYDESDMLASFSLNDKSEYILQIVGNGGKGSIQFIPNGTNVRITHIATPTSETDAANKAYVDSAIQAAIQNTWKGSY